MAFLIAAKTSVSLGRIPNFVVRRRDMRKSSSDDIWLLEVCFAYRVCVSTHNVGGFVPANAVVVFFNENLPVGLTSFRTESKESGV
jgi:hypothetical protein